MNSDTPATEPTPNVHTTATSGLDPEVSIGTDDAPAIPDEGSGTRDGTVDDVRPLGLSEDPALDDPDYYADEDSTGTAEGTDPDASEQQTEGTAEGTVEGVALDPESPATGDDGNPVNSPESDEAASSGDGSNVPAPESGDDENGPQNGS